MADQTGQKSRFDRWVSVLQLLVTVLTGVGVALLINHGNQQLQLQIAEQEDLLHRELPKLQAEAARQANLADLELQPTCVYSASCDGAFRLSNKGQAAARDVETHIIVVDVNALWRHVLTDSQMLSVKYYPPTLHASDKPEKVEVFYPGVSPEGNNAILSWADMLPSNGKLQTLIDFNIDSSFVEVVAISRTLTITNVVMPEDTADRIPNLLLRYLESEYWIAKLSLETICSNCEVTGQENFFIPISSLSSWNRVPSGDNQYNLQINYYVPEGSGHLPDSSPLNLEVQSLANGEFEFREVP